MPDRSVHIAVGVPAGAAFSLYCARRQNPREMLIEGFGGALGGFSGALVPDLVDTPDDPNHRGIAHGVAPVGGMGYAAAQTFDEIQGYFRARANQYAVVKQNTPSPVLSVCYELLEILMRVIAGAIAGFVAGYASHVILDFATPRSLPLFS